MQIMSNEAKMVDEAMPGKPEKPYTYYDGKTMTQIIDKVKTTLTTLKADKAAPVMLDRSMSAEELSRARQQIMRTISTMHGVKFVNNLTLHLDQPGATEDQTLQVSKALRQGIVTFLCSPSLVTELESGGARERYTFEELMEWLHAELEGDFPLHNDVLFRTCATLKAKEWNTDTFSSLDGEVQLAASAILLSITGALDRHATAVHLRQKALNDVSSWSGVGSKSVSRSEQCELYVSNALAC